GDPVDLPAASAVTLCQDTAGAANHLHIHHHRPLPRLGLRDAQSIINRRRACPGSLSFGRGVWCWRSSHKAPVPASHPNPHPLQEIPISASDTIRLAGDQRGVALVSLRLDQGEVRVLLWEWQMGTRSASVFDVLVQDWVGKYATLPSHIVPHENSYQLPIRDPFTLPSIIRAPVPSSPRPDQVGDPCSRGPDVAARLRRMSIRRWDECQLITPNVTRPTHSGGPSPSLTTASAPIDCEIDGKASGQINLHQHVLGLEPTATRRGRRRRVRFNTSCVCVCLCLGHQWHVLQLSLLSPPCITALESQTFQPTYQFWQSTCDVH
ncbi:hypothetical protein B0T19DRAFT_454151, partial [Cercophora scortea]